MANHLIHPKLKGAYVYGITVDGVVRYIGKGRRYRVTEHFGLARRLNERRANGEKIAAMPVHNKLAKALRLETHVGYVIFAFDLDDAAALERERNEIAAAPAGTLWNITAGGDAGLGEYLKALWGTAEFRAKLIASRKISHTKPEFRERQREGARRQFDDPVARANFMRSHRALWDDPQSAAERRALLKRVWADPEKSARKSALVKSQWTPERCSAMAENRRRAWADPEFKARVLAKMHATRATNGFRRKKTGPRCRKNVGPQGSLFFHAAESEKV